MLLLTKIIFNARLLLKMNFRSFLAIFFGISHVTRLIFVILAILEFSKEHTNWMISYIVLYGLLYLLQIVSFAKNVGNLILSIFGLVWFRVPFVVKKKKFYNSIIAASVIDLVNNILGGFLSGYITIQTNLLPIWIPLVHFILCTLTAPILYEGTLFNSHLTIPISTYFMLTIESFLNYAFTSIIITLPYFWIVFCVAAWRFILLFEPFAFWASLKSSFSPFRAMENCKSARSLVAVYLLYMELFLLIYCTAWFMDYNAKNIVFVVIIAVYYVGFIFQQIISNFFPFSHKIKPISWANEEEPHIFDPAVL